MRKTNRNNGQRKLRQLSDSVTRSVGDVNAMSNNFNVATFGMKKTCPCKVGNTLAKNAMRVNGVKNIRTKF